MNLNIVEISYKTAPVEIRERLSFSKRKIINANRTLKERACLEEGLILSTCNRVEVYSVDNVPGRDHLKEIGEFLGEFHDVDPGGNKINNIYLYDIDDIRKIVDKNLALRKDELKNCQKIVALSSERFMDWFTSEKLVYA